MKSLTGNKNLDIDILNQLDDKDLVSFCKTSKYANQLCNDQILWQRRVISKFGDIIPLDIMKKYKGDAKWSDYYIELSTKMKSNINWLLRISSDGRLDLAILALNNGADIHTIHDYALRRASANGHLEVVKYLVSQGADIHAYDDEAVTNASANGYLELVKYLVSQGADIHAKGDYAFILSSVEGHLEVVKYLVSQGADIHASEALKWARNKGHTEVVKYLEEQMKK